MSHEEQSIDNGLEGVRTVGELLNAYAVLESKHDENERKIAALEAQLKGLKIEDGKPKGADVIFMIRNESARFYKVCVDLGLYSVAEAYAEVVHSLDVWKTTGWRTRSLSKLEDMYNMSGDYWKPFFFRELSADLSRS